jgi:hypothetical protein
LPHYPPAVSIPRWSPSRYAASRTSRRR